MNIVPYIEALRYRSLKTSISKCIGIEYRTQYRSTSISKLNNFDIEVVYTISKIFQELRYRSHYFDIVSQTHTLRYLSFCTLYRRYLKYFDTEDVSSIKKFVPGLRLLPCRREIESKSQHQCQCPGPGLQVGFMQLMGVWFY